MSFPSALFTQSTQNEVNIMDNVNVYGCWQTEAKQSCVLTAPGSLGE